MRNLLIPTKRLLWSAFALLVLAIAAAIWPALALPWALVAVVLGLGPVGVAWAAWRLRGATR